jgi:hypothetical protein
MTRQALPATVVLHCEIEVDGQTLWADTLISRRAWDVSDEVQREAFHNRAREALADAVTRHYQAAIDAAPVVITEER